MTFLVRQTHSPALIGRSLAAGPARNGATDAAARIRWVDYSKGWCIILVVTMHSALGVGLALGETGWLHALVAFAKPFRMPDFFIVAGLFVGRALDRPWRTYLDRKVVHFLYFYALWMLLVLAVKAGDLGIASATGFARAYAYAFVQPFSTMWFIQLLPLLFLTVRIARALPWPIQIGAAAALHLLSACYTDDTPFTMNSTMTGWITFDSFTLYLVYFLIGHHFRGAVFAFADAVAARPLVSLLGLLAWGVGEAVSVSHGWPDVPGLTLLYGGTGALAVVAVSSLLGRLDLAPWLAYCGRHSLAVYLAFVIPMAATRLILIRSGLVTDPGWMSAIVAVCALLTPLALEAATRRTWLAGLFHRPAWARIAPAR